MKQKRLKLSVLLFFGFGLTSVHSQTMYVKEKTGIQSDYTLSNIRKLTFSVGNMTVAKNNNDFKVFALNDLRYLNFTDPLTGLEVLPIQGISLLAYPNPVKDILNIQITGSLNNDRTLSIYSLDNKLILNRLINKGSIIIPLDLSSLIDGIYQ
jgi:hypothetical protein